MVEFIIAVLAVIFVLGVAINIHEFGHFIVAKWFGMRVEAYSFFGLGPRLFGFKWGHTDYRVSAIPLGAYVKLYGDESNNALEGADDSADPVPASELYELRPRWQKFLVMVGGPVMNILLALAIPFAGALMYGIPATPAPTVEQVDPNGAAERAGIRPGDRIVAFDGVENPTYRRIESDALLLADKQVPVTVERSGERINLTITPSKFEQSGQSAGKLDFRPDRGAQPVFVGTLEPGMPAANAGLQPGDRIISVNGAAVRNWDNTVSLIQASKGEQPLLFVIERNGEQRSVEMRAQLEKGVPRVGIAPSSSAAGMREPATFAQAAAFAWNSNLEILRLTGKAFGQVGTGERSARDTVSGPIGIVQIISQVALGAGWAGLFSILALISLNLGVFNLLPIPMLDGGQIMVLGIEGILSLFGLQLSMLIKERIQLTGLAIVLLLMVFVIFNDLSRIVGL